MQYVQYGKDGPLVSRLGFGVMRLPTRKKGGWGKVHFTRSTEIMRASMKAGVNFFDSHHHYHGGNSELAIGKALKGWKGQRIYIQTKAPWYNDKPEDHFKKLLDEALEKLGVCCIDYFLHHAMSMDVWKKRGKKFIQFTDWAMNQGLIRRRGFSSHDKPENIKKFIDTGEFSAMLVSYNWMNPEVRDVIAYAAEKGMGVSVMNPVGGGVLGTSTRQITRLLPGAKSAAEISLRYVLATRGVTCALSGMNTMGQVRENTTVASRKTSMTTRQRTHMRNRLKKIESASKKFCTACGYCMPCKNGVDIPGNFQLLSRALFFGQTAWAKGRYSHLKQHKDGDKSAEACKSCGSCEPKCPNNVPIIEQLKQAATVLGK